MPLYQPAGAASPAATARQTYFTAGSITFDADIPAVVGDWVELSAGGMWAHAGGGNDFIDWAVVVGTSAVRYSSTGTGTPATQGDPAYYPDSGFFKGTGPFAFKVVSGDLDSGSVRFTIAHIGVPGGGTLYSSTDYPLRLRAVNFHAVT